MINDWKSSLSDFKTAVQGSAQQDMAVHACSRVLQHADDRMAAGTERWAVNKTWQYVSGWQRNYRRYKKHLLIMSLLQAAASRNVLQLKAATVDAFQTLRQNYLQKAASLRLLRQILYTWNAEKTCTAFLTWNEHFRLETTFEVHTLILTITRDRKHTLTITVTTTDTLTISS